MLNADLAIGSDIVIAVSCFQLTARDDAAPAFFKALSAAPLAELDAVRGKRRDPGGNRAPLRVCRAYQAWRRHDGQ